MVKLERLGEFYVRPEALKAKIRSLEMVPPENRFNAISPFEIVSNLEAVIVGIDPASMNLVMGKIKNYGDMLDIFQKMSYGLSSNAL